MNPKVGNIVKYTHNCQTDAERNLLQKSEQIGKIVSIHGCTLKSLRYTLNVGMGKQITVMRDGISQILL
jgi:hypothetical protein